MDPDDPRPPYQQIAADLEDAIAIGRFAPGSQLPSRAALAASYKVAPMTVQRAIQELVNKGLAVGRQGQGVFVRTRQGPPILADLVDLADRIDAGEFRRMSQVSRLLREIVDEYR